MRESEPNGRPPRRGGSILGSRTRPDPPVTVRAECHLCKIRLRRGGELRDDAQRHFIHSFRHTADSQPPEHLQGAKQNFAEFKH